MAITSIARIFRMEILSVRPRFTGILLVKPALNTCRLSRRIAKPAKQRNAATFYGDDEVCNLPLLLSRHPSTASWGHALMVELKSEQYGQRMRNARRTCLPRTY